MTPTTPASMDVELTLHNEIKFRAYELYEMQRGTNGKLFDDSLNSELSRVVYAAAELAKYKNGEVGDTMRVRAARVYLGALSSLLGTRTLRH